MDRTSPAEILEGRLSFSAIVFSGWCACRGVRSIHRSGNVRSLGSSSRSPNQVQDSPISSGTRINSYRCSVTIAPHNSWVSCWVNRKPEAT
jgi:hypothetical protein